MKESKEILIDSNGILILTDFHSISIDFKRNCNSISIDFKKQF